MINRQSYTSVYRSLLASKDLQPLSKFKSNRSIMMFPDALTIPNFFQSNLVAPGRVIKVVKGNCALLRAFFYQLMKLTFEIEVSSIDYVQICKSVIFHPGLLQDQNPSASSDKGLTDWQYKRIIADFMQMISQQSIPNFEFTLMQYPVIDQALSKTLQSLVVRCYQGQENTQSILHWLSKTFSVNVEKHGRCYKFQQSDIFLLEEAPDEYYLAFLNEMAEVSDFSESTTNKFKDKRKREDDFFQHSQLHIYPEDRFRYSAQPGASRPTVFDNQPSYRKTIDPNSFHDYGRNIAQSMHDSKAQSQASRPSQMTHSKIGSLIDMMSDHTLSDRQPPVKITEQHHTLQKKHENIEQMSTPQFTSYVSFAQQRSAPFMQQKYSDNYMNNIYDKNPRFDYITDTIQQNYADKAQQKYSDSLELNKNQLQRQLAKVISQRNTQQQVLYNPKKSKLTVQYKQVKTIKPDDSVGTLYRQFTDTRVMQAMTSHQSNNVNMIRQRYRGMHRRDLGRF